MQVVITTNSPGEVSAWVIPVAAALFDLGVKVDVVLTPCTFATGKEAEVLKKERSVRTVFDPNEYWKIALGLKKIPKEKNGCVLFLGGDLWHARHLGRLLRYPVAAYSTKRALKGLEIVFVPNSKVFAAVAKTVGTERVKLTGDLMFANLKPLAKKRLENQIALFPGSRDHVRSILPFFLKVAELLYKKEEKAEFVISLSRFADKAKIQEALACSSGLLEGVRGKVLGENLLRTENGLEIPFYYNRQFEIMESSAFALTIPGTNTAEMAFFGLPHISVLPLNIAREIPLEGLFGLISQIPGIGPWLKERVIWKKAPSLGFTALSNILAGSEVVPEIKGFLTAEKVASGALKFYRDRKKRLEITSRLHDLYPKSEADRIIAETLVKRWGDKQ